MSWCFSAYYVRPGDPDALRQRHKGAKDVGGGWFAVRVGDSIDYDAYDDSPETAATLDLSREYGEAFYVYGYSGTDDMVYEHSRSGQLLRKLLWVSDGSSSSWLCA